VSTTLFGIMSATGQFPSVPGPGAPEAARRTGQASAGRSLLSSLAIVLGSLIAGLAGGQIWVELAPRASYVIVSQGSADVINPETSAFIAGDAVYCMIGLAGGLIIGLAGYLLAVRRYGPAPMAAILAGSAAAGVVARWVGEHSGLTAFNHNLLTGPIGTHLAAPLALAGDTAASIWPSKASLPEVAFWPLAASLMAGGLALVVVLRERSAAVTYAAPHPGPPQPWGSYQGQ